MTLQEILPMLEGVQGGPVQYSAKCPAHEDNRQSLSLSQDGDKVLITCHAGCPTETVAEALGLSMADLFNGPKEPPSLPKQPPTVVATYDYTDESGKLLARKVRRSDKSFYWLHPDGAGSMAKGGIKDPPLYNMPVVASSKALYIVEGEKDVDTLKAHGKAATSLSNGAKSKWLPQYSEVLRGKDVAIIPDNDGPGWEYAQRIAKELNGVAKSVRLVDLRKIWPEMPEKNDVSDLLEIKGAEALQEVARLARETEEYNPGAEQDKQPMELEGENLSIDLLLAVLDHLGIKVWRDLIVKKTKITGMPREYSKGEALNTLPAYLLDWLTSRGVKRCTKERICDILGCIADRNRKNPFKDELIKGKWDGLDRVWEYYRILGVDQAKHQNLIRKWLIQVVAMGIKDENDMRTGAEGILVFSGPQGIGKTSAFRLLLPVPEWFTEGVTLDLHNKDSVIGSTGGLITELGELDATLKKEQTEIKAFLTKPLDSYRLPYAASETDVTRRTSFCATVNDDKFLKDETGSRRFFTVPLTHIDKKTLFSLSAEWWWQLWFQVYALYKEAPKGFRLTDEERAQLERDNMGFQALLPFETEVREVLDWSLPVEKWEWWRASEFIPFVQKASASQIGKVFARLYNESCKKRVGEEKAISSFTPTNPAIRMKPGNGSTWYLLPKRHYAQG